jgi:hypothetical protein
MRLLFNILKAIIRFINLESLIKKSFFIEIIYIFKLNIILLDFFAKLLRRNY